ncbi:MAG TPA: ABC transporter substrate-binding protein [Acidimicrobiia bacterium]|nr:ABC transporter substrate-binding protein [Acidimicrobiia bacterium]
MTKPVGLRLLALLAALAMIVASCTADTADTTAPTGGDGEGTTTTAAGGGGGEGTAGGSLRIGLIANITTDNWWASLDTESASQNQAYLTNSKTTLFRLALPGFVYVPAMATTEAPVEPVQEGDVWVVEQPIHEDRTWSDGTPITANDLAFYFDTVKEFNLGSDHASSFSPAVLSITAPDDHTVRVEFSEAPGLNVWNNGVGFASFVPSHFWQEHVDAARAAAESVTAGITSEDATAAIVEAAAGDDDPDNDIAAGDVTQEQIDEYITDAGSQEAVSVLYTVSGVGEPSAGPVIVDQWEAGAFAATVANPGYVASGTENTLYSDGSFRIANAERGEDAVYGGEGRGEVVAHYIEGPFVSEILWVEHTTKESAYEKLAAGELDYVYDPTGLTSGLHSELATFPDLQFSVNQSEGFRYMAFNMRKAPMSDLAFRRATATVINKELIADTVLADAVFPGYTIIHPDLTAHYNADVERAGWADGEPMTEADRFNSAIQILRDAGYTWTTEPVVVTDAGGNFLEVAPKGEGLTMPNGTSVPELTILTPGPEYDPFRATFSIYIEAWMQDLGIPVTAEATDFDAIRIATFPPQTPESALAWDMYVLGWGPSEPSLPGAALRAFFHSDQDVVTGGGFNVPGYRSAEFDAIANAFDAAVTLEEAAALTKEMDAIVARDLPYVVLFRTPIIEAFRSNVRFPVDQIMGGQSGYPNAWPNAVDVTQ